jgi:hypothetical protein
MAVVNHSKREINVKVVYAGLAHAGKATNLAIVQQRLKPEFRGQARTIPMGDSTLHLCEFHPPGSGAIPGFALRFHLYTLTATDLRDPQWRMVLKGADGIVYVAHAAPAESVAVRDGFTELLAQMNSLGLDLSQVPIVVQANFQDLPGALDEKALAALLTVPGITVHPATAARGQGVLETLATVVRKVTAILQKQEFPPPLADAQPADDTEAADNDELPSQHAESSSALSSLLPCASSHEPAGDSVPRLPELTPDGVPLEIPVALSIAGIERQFVLTVSLREAGTVPCEPLRGAGYVR